MQRFNVLLIEADSERWCDVSGWHDGLGDNTITALPVTP